MLRQFQRIKLPHLPNISQLSRSFYPIQPRQKPQLADKIIFQFSEDKNETPGFEKFQRKKKTAPVNSDKKDKEQLQDDPSTQNQKEPKEEERQMKKEKNTNQQTEEKKSIIEYQNNQKDINQPNEDKMKSEDNKRNDEQKEEKQEQDEKPEQKQGEKKNEEEDWERYRKYSSLGAFIGVNLLLWNYFNQEVDLSYAEFQSFLESNQIESINIRYDVSTMSTGHQYMAIVKVKDNYKNFYLTLANPNNFLENLERNQVDRGIEVEEMVKVQFEVGKDFKKGLQIVTNLTYFALVLYIGFSMYKGFKGMSGVPKKHFKQYVVEEKVKVKFRDVAGLDEAKIEITEFVDFLGKPKKYAELGAKIPRGALLTGPPGTGKTMLAKACAGEAGVPFFYVSGSEFVEMFVGMGAARVRELFKEAKEKQPSIIFIDEIDAIGKKRAGSQRGGNEERDNTLNQLLVEMDGFGTDANVVVLAATNMVEVLDPALTRPGRFDRSIQISLPDIRGRKEVFLVHLAPLKLDLEKRTEEEYAKRLATLTPGFSGADIANLCNEAAILAARQNKKFVDPVDFEMAAERVMGGLIKKTSMSAEDRRKVAFHESGHAVVSWFLEGGHPLLKLTIIPRSKGSQGYAQYLPNESSLQTKDELLDLICCTLGGRCAEEIIYGNVTTSAYDDIKKAQDMAYSMVTKLGMSDLIGYVAMRQGDYSKSFSEDTNKIIDQEVQKIIRECSERTKNIIREKEGLIRKLTETLLIKETLDLQQLIEILGERPIQPKSNYKAYLEVQKAMAQG